MKKYIAIFTLFLFSMDMFAFETFPENTSEENIKKYLDQIFSSNDDVEDVFYYIDRTNKVDYLIPFIKVFKKYYIEKNYRVPSGGNWMNPINVAINLNRLDLISEIITIDPDLISQNDKGGQFDGIEPIAYAVKNGIIDLVILLLPYIKDINSVISVGGNHISNYSDLDVNLLSISTSEVINKILIEKGIKQLGNNIHYPNSFITDNNVNLRNGPGLEYSIFEKVNKDIKVVISGYIYKYFSINGIKGRWIKVLYKSKELWVFEPYVFIYSQ